MKPNRLGRFTANLALVLIASATGLLAFEVILRWLEPATDVELLTERHTPSGNMLVLRPGIQGRVLGRTVSVNAEAYRGPLRPREKPAGTMRVLVFGDSHTFSMGADDDHTYPAVAERKLNAQGLPVQFVNFGVPGQDLRQYLVLLRERALAYDPDLVVVTFHDGDILESADDMIVGTAGKSSPPQGFAYRMKVFSLQHSYVARMVFPYASAFLRRALGWNPGVIDAELRELENNGATWQRLQADVLDARRMLQQHGIALAFVLFPNMLPFEEHPSRRGHERLAQWLTMHDIPALDLLPAFRGHDASSLTASLLDKHPNEAGYAIAGEAVADFLAPGLRAMIARGAGPAAR